MSANPPQLPTRASTATSPTVAHQTEPSTLHVLSASVGEPPHPDTDYPQILRRGLWIVLAGFGGFLAWATLAPLDEGIPASGVVVAESNRKRIEHLHGGIVEQIRVREGQRVKAGEELIVLNETQGRSALNATQTQHLTATATLSRLLAERDGAPAIPFPAELRSAAVDAPEVAALMRSQESLFRSRRDALEGELRIIRESVRGLEIQLASLAQLRQGRETQIALFEEQLASFRDLRKHGFVSRNNLLELERQLAEVQSKLSEDMSNIAGVNARLAEFRMRGAQREAEYRREVEGQISEIQREVATLGEQLNAQQDTVARLVLRAPVDGTVVDLTTHTVGGVVKPGDRVMDIVPEDDSLVIEARLAPPYVDRIHVGLPAHVHFDVHSVRIDRPMVSGEVTTVSADVLQDPRSGEPYFAVRIRVGPDEAAKLGSLRLQPGMPTTVMVKTGERSLMVYLMQPLLRRATTAFTEG
jgi:membrane fusion protein, protease secretion system